MNRLITYAFRNGFIINGFTKYVKHTSQCIFSYRYGNGRTCCLRIHSSHQSVSRSHGDTSYRIITQMLCYLDCQIGTIRASDPDCFIDLWKVPFFELNIEYGTDNLSGTHKLPSVMWSAEYQNEYLEMTHAVFDHYDFVQGELVWNFADFQTTEGILRVDGNKKGIFTRQRQPKDAAYLFRKRWTTLPVDFKKRKK